MTSHREVMNEERKTGRKSISGKTLQKPNWRIFQSCMNFLNLEKDETRPIHRNTGYSMRLVCFFEKVLRTRGQTNRHKPLIEIQSAHLQNRMTSRLSLLVVPVRFVVSLFTICDEAFAKLKLFIGELVQKREKQPNFVQKQSVSAFFRGAVFRM